MAKRRKRKSPEKRRRERPSQRSKAKQQPNNAILSRRNFIQAGVAAAALSALGFVLCDKDDCNGKKPKPAIHRSDPNRTGGRPPQSPQGKTWGIGHENEKDGISEERVRDTAELIPKLEKAFKELELVFMQKAAKIPEGPFKKNLIAPFELVRLNEKNPDRNGPKYRREQMQKGNSTSRTSNINYFFYDVEDIPGAIAGYLPAYKKMSLSKNFDANDILDLIVFFHELKHALHDTTFRTKVNTKEEWDAYLAERINGKVDVIDEATAYAYELEALDLLLDHDLRRIVTGQLKPDFDDLRRRLRTKKTDRQIQLFIDLAKFYFPEGMNGGRGLSKRFVNFIARNERARGMQVMIKTRSGRLKPFFRK